MVVVTDTGPLIHLAEVDALHLLRTFDTVVVPEAVYEELEAGGVPDAFEAGAFEIQSVSAPADAFPELDAGETAALVRCEREDYGLLTDDLAARNAASERGIDVHGSIGVLLRAFSRGALNATETKALIRSLEQDTSLYLSSPLLEHAIHLVESELADWE